MKRSIILSMCLTLMVLSCKKNNSALNPNIDNTVNWVGTYNDPVLGAPYVINTVVVTKADNTHVKMMLVINNFGTLDTFSFLKNVILNTGTTASIRENEIVSGDTATYHFTGNCSLNIDTLIASGTGVNISNPYDQQVFYFVGSK